MYASGELAGNRYIEAYYNWNIQIMSGKYQIIKKAIQIKMAIDVYEYGRGGTCVWMFEYTYTFVGEVNIQM